MSVVLPAPSGPTRPRICPSGSVAVMPSSARVAPKLFTSALTLAAGRVGGGAGGVAGAAVLMRCAEGWMPQCAAADAAAISTVTGIPCRNTLSGSLAMTRMRYTRSSRTCSVCTVLGVNSASGEMKPTVPS